ncbi:MAG: D-tyrosyl-tRNA(Tyr) deacylase [Acidimicrobiales bacterium]|nr:D-tyrosyl-tRNA(Tyr) deacylase [Acidimicrobiales bacterium]
MRLVVQRVGMAAVSVDGEMVGQIGPGLCVFVGITHDDDDSEMQRMAEKLVKLRIFSDSEDKMNLSVTDVGGDILLVSQFTLYGDSSKGNRPSFVRAARPEQALPLFRTFMERVVSSGLTVATGRFGADMKVMIANDGPVTLILET